MKLPISFTFISNGIAFSSLGGMQLPVSWPAAASIKAPASQMFWISGDLQKQFFIIIHIIGNRLLENDPSNTRKASLKKKGGINNTNIKSNNYQFLLVLTEYFNTQPFE